MEENSKRFLPVENLEVYQAARRFRGARYAVSRKPPDFEKYGPARQIRTAAVSLPHNIAEGHGRRPYADHLKFMLQARGAREELWDDLNMGAVEQEVSAAEVATLKVKGWRVGNLLNGHSRHLRETLNTHNLSLRATPPAYQAALPFLPDAPGFPSLPTTFVTL